MSHLRISLVAIAAVLLVGCASGPATETAGTAKNTDTKIGAAPKPGAEGEVKAGTMQMQPGPGAGGVDTRVGSKAK